ncbi:MAG: hypothetical protein ACRDK9_05140 [Solirubrobacterales bacterium]
MLVLVPALSIAACGGEESGPGAETRLEAVLATVRTGDPVGTGYGWVDVERLRETPGRLGDQLSWAADALGPGAREIGRAESSLNRIGIEPLRTKAMLSTATSYALSLRLDGVSTGRFENALERAGARSRDGGEWTTLALGTEWSIPLGSQLEGLGSIVARSATGESQIVLARSALARARMLNSGEPAIEATPIAVAADCLGNVVAARLVLNNHTHLPNVGPDLLAFGVLQPGPGPTREVLCVIDESSEPIDAAHRSLQEAFDADAHDEVSDEPMRTLIMRSHAEAFDREGLRVARAELVLVPGAEPGLLFAAFSRGSLLTYIGLQRPLGV